MNEGVGVVIVGLASAVTLVALFLAVAALFRDKTDRARRAADESPGRSFVIGAVNVLFLSALGFGFSALAEGVAQVLQLPAVLFLSLLAILIVFGLSAAAALIGERLFPAAGAYRRRLGGSVVLVLASLAPFVGWFGFFPYVVCLGSGGFILGLFRAVPEPAAPAVEQEAVDHLSD